MKRVTFHEDADSEVLDAVRYYEAKASGLGMSFLLDVEEAVEQISTNPDGCQRVAEEVRHKLLRRFPYCVGTRPRASIGSWTSEATAKLLDSPTVGAMRHNPKRHSHCCKLNI